MCLEAENAALLRERCEANDACLKEITRAEKAEAENAALRVDAERYRWLRRYADEDFLVGKSEDGVDAAIDAAMSKT
jgi:hypothetical protein